MRLIFVEQGYPRKLFNLEHFPIYGTYIIMTASLSMDNIIVCFHFYLHDFHDLLDHMMP